MAYKAHTVLCSHLLCFPCPHHSPATHASSLFLSKPIPFFLRALVLSVPSPWDIFPPDIYMVFPPPPPHSPPDLHTNVTFSLSPVLFFAKPLQALLTISDMPCIIPCLPPSTKMSVSQGQGFLSFHLFPAP